MKATNGYAKLFQAALGPRYDVHTEFHFHPTRRWRFDLVVCTSGTPTSTPFLAVEIDGGGFVQGRHSRGTGIEKDCEKYAEAMILGWRILRVTPKQIKDGRAFDWIQKILQ